MKTLAELELEAALGWEFAATSWLRTALYWLDAGRPTNARACLGVARADLELAALGLRRWGGSPS